MNNEWAIKELTEFIDGSTTHEVQYGDNRVGTYLATAISDDDLTKQAQVVERILARVLPDWRRQMLAQVVHSMRWQAQRDVCIRARAVIEREDEVRANLGDDAPELSAAELHPWIWDGATSLWQSGHYREAVEGAIKKLNAETQNKVDRRDVSETDLFKQAFSTDAPKPKKARLRRMNDDGSDTYRSVQRGAMAFAEGVFAGIRNPLSHEADQELSEQEALEYLATLSVLARWVDGSIVEVAS
jgi:hypothetical protein